METHNGPPSVNRFSWPGDWREDLTAVRILNERNMLTLSTLLTGKSWAGESLRADLQRRIAIKMIFRLLYLKIGQLAVSGVILLDKCFTFSSECVCPRKKFYPANVSVQQYDGSQGRRQGGLEDAYLLFY